MADSATDDILRAFGATVRTLRMERGLSQERLAELVGVHRTYLGDIERGERNVALRNIHRLALALEVSMADLMTGTEHQSRRGP